MGTSVQMIESYYGKHSTNLSVATLLGGPLVVKKNSKKGKDGEQA